MLSVPSDCPSLVPPDSSPAGAEALHAVWSGDHIDQSRWHLLLETKPEKSTELPSLMSDQSPSYAYLIRLGWPSMSHDHLINKELCQSCSLLQCHQGTLCLSSLPCTMYCTDVGLIKVEIWTWYFEILLVYDATRLTYNCAHLRSTKESLTDSVKNLFVRKKILCENFLGENLLGEHFLSEHFFWVKFFGWTFFWVKIVGEIFVGDIFLGEHFFEWKFLGENFLGEIFFLKFFFWIFFFEIFFWKFFVWKIFF